MNWPGVVLLLSAFVFLLVDLKVTNHGLPTAAAILTLVLGGVTLSGVMAPYPWASSAVAAMLALLAGATLLVIFREARAARGIPAATGVEGIIGEEGVVRRPVEVGSPGWVFVHGELWRAVAATPPEDVYEGDRDLLMRVGSRVKVVDLGDGKVAVEPLGPARSGPWPKEGG